VRLLVTGRTGQMARALFEAGALARDSVVVAGRPELDLRDPASIAAAIVRETPDIVVNAAAYTQVDQAETDDAAAFAVNADGAGHVAAACAAHGVPIIHLSTDYVFDGSKDAAYREDDAVAPINSYGRSKLAGEQAVAAAGPRHLIVRTSWIYSPWGSNFVRTMLRLAQARPSINVVDDQHGCPTYALDLADALLVIARRALTQPDDMPWGIVHAAGQGETAWHEFASAIFERAPAHGLPAAQVVPIPTSDYPTPARRPANSRLDCALLRQRFGAALPHWRDGVDACLARIAYHERTSAPRAPTIGDGAS
jgi:dTDP-4-dehydrorhamnose reductase